MDIDAVLETSWFPQKYLYDQHWQALPSRHSEFSLRLWTTPRTHRTYAHLRKRPSGFWFCGSSDYLQYEKVTRSYKTGVYVSMGDFRAKLCNKWVKQYNKNFDKTTAKWWNSILQYYVDGDPDCEDDDEMSNLDDTRAALPRTP